MRIEKREDRRMRTVIVISNKWYNIIVIYCLIGGLGLWGTFLSPHFLKLLQAIPYPWNIPIVLLIGPSFLVAFIMIMFFDRDRSSGETADKVEK